MKQPLVLHVLISLVILSGSAWAQGTDNQSGRNSTPLGVTASGVIELYPPSEVPPKTCVYNNIIHSSGARICVGFDLATCTENGTWDSSEKGSRDSPRCNRSEFNQGR
jgi:hypothetical protein